MEWILLNYTNTRLFCYKRINVNELITVVAFSQFENFMVKRKLSNFIKKFNIMYITMLRISHAYHEIFNK